MIAPGAGERPAPTGGGAGSTRRKRALLWSAWLLAFAVGATCTSAFTWGVLRDTHFEEVRIDVDLARPSGERATAFRVWGSGTYAVYLTTVHTRSRPGAPAAGEVEPRFEGSIEVRVTDPDGETRLRQTFAPDDLDHVRPSNTTWSRLAGLELGGIPLRAWRLATRVTEGDARFAAADGLRSEVLIQKERTDPGMGGLINYVLLLPGLLFSLLSLGLGVALIRAGGSRVPLILSVASLLPLAAWGL